jgi:hypothetical protein
MTKQETFYSTFATGTTMHAFDVYLRDEILPEVTKNGGLIVVDEVQLPAIQGRMARYAKKAKYIDLRLLSGKNRCFDVHILPKSDRLTLGVFFTHYHRERNSDCGFSEDAVDAVSRFIECFFEVCVLFPSELSFHKPSSDFSIHYIESVLWSLRHEIDKPQCIHLYRALTEKGLIITFKNGKGELSAGNGGLEYLSSFLFMLEELSVLKKLIDNKRLLSSSWELSNIFESREQVTIVVCSSPKSGSCHRSFVEMSVAHGMLGVLSENLAKRDEKISLSPYTIYSSPTLNVKGSIIGKNEPINTAMHSTKLVGYPQKFVNEVEYMHLLTKANRTIKV